MSDEKKLAPTSEHYAIAQSKMALTDWVALPAELLDRDRAMRELSDGAVRAALRLIEQQWRERISPYRSEGRSEASRAAVATRAGGDEAVSIDREWRTCTLTSCRATREESRSDCREYRERPRGFG